MKKLFTFISISLALSLAACGGGGDDLVQSAEAVEAPEAMLTAAAAVTDPMAAERVANASFDDHTVTLGSNYKVPTDWACTNYPRLARACMYAPGEISILSAPIGSTITARYAFPVNPNWWSGITIPEAGVYTLTATVIKQAWNANTSERAQQAVLIKDGLTTLLSIPHLALVPGVEQTVTVEVPLAAGAHTLSFATAMRNSYGTYGYLYRLTSLSVQKAL